MYYDYSKIMLAQLHTKCIFHDFFVSCISDRHTDLSLLKEFSKKTVLKIFIILFEQDCPEAVVHGLFHES